MKSPDDYKGQVPTWCPGCGNFGILKAYQGAMAELGREPHELVMVSGIGQAGKFPHYTVCNTFNGLHGRSIPVATGIKLSNREIKVIAVGGDGDMYGEGGNHLVHAMRRNIGISVFVHDNQVYGLTKGQASPTSMEGFITSLQPQGVLSEQLSPLAMAVALDCSFVARGYAGDQEHLQNMIKAAVTHDGFALLDILQPCVTFNKVNTYGWYGKRVYHIDGDHDPQDRLAAFKKSLEWGDRIPIGIIYKNNRIALEKRMQAASASTPVDQPLSIEHLRSAFSRALKSYY